jgi:NAD-dependent dihydropyrimidine dehydrogenase PreA subunit
MDPSYRTRRVTTEFAFQSDGGSFAAAAERCFGVGACRDQDATMCPSYQVTLEEKHSTRGRARLLLEMMRSDSLEGGWRNESVKEALDLCLACKGCKHECPVRVDMATYKAEFLSHYWKRRLRPPHAYALGLIYWEARLAAHAPALANVLLQREPLASAGRRALGIAEERKPPALRAPDVQELVPCARAPPPGRRRPARPPLARHLQQSLPPRGRHRRRRGPRGGRLRGGDPRPAAVLRAPPLRLRDADAGQAPAAPDPRRAASRARSGNARGRPRAELRRRLPRRAHRALPR